MGLKVIFSCFGGGGGVVGTTCISKFSTMNMSYLCNKLQIRNSEWGNYSGGWGKRITWPQAFKASGSNVVRPLSQTDRERENQTDTQTEKCRWGYENLCNLGQCVWEGRAARTETPWNLLFPNPWAPHWMPSVVQTVSLINVHIKSWPW
jgi:hypothetical protein